MNDQGCGAGGTGKILSANQLGASPPLSGSQFQDTKSPTVDITQLTFFWSVTKICVSSSLSPVLCVLHMVVVEGPTFKHAIITSLLQSGRGTLSKATRCAGICTKKAQVSCSSACWLYQHRQKGVKIFYNLSLRQESDSLQALETNADGTESWSPPALLMW